MIVKAATLAAPTFRDAFLFFFLPFFDACKKWGQIPEQFYARDRCQTHLLILGYITQVGVCIIEERKGVGSGCPNSDCQITAKEMGMSCASYFIYILYMSKLQRNATRPRRSAAPGCGGTICHSASIIILLHS